MSLKTALSQTLCGIQVGAIDAIILCCLMILTSDIQDKEGRGLLRVLLFAGVVLAQIFAGATNVDKGGTFWDPVLEIAYVSMGLMIGGMGVYWAYVEMGRRMEGNGAESEAPKKEGPKKEERKKDDGWEKVKKDGAGEGEEKSGGSGQN